MINMTNMYVHNMYVQLTFFDYSRDDVAPLLIISGKRIPTEASSVLHDPWQGSFRGCFLINSFGAKIQSLQIHLICAQKEYRKSKSRKLFESLWKSRVFQLCSSVELCSKNIATWIVLVSLVECARMKAEKNVEAHEFHNLILQVKVSATIQRWDIYIYIFTYIRSIGMQQRASWTLGVCTSMSASHPVMEKPRWTGGN